MIKRVLIATIALSLILIVGCAEVSDLTEGLTNKSSEQSLEIIREAKLGTSWQMNQMGIELAADDEVSILMKLANGDKVDGYFYLEKGKDIDFQIIGDSLIHELQVRNSGESVEPTSDRFSFVADDTQGDAYTLTFRNAGDAEQAKVKIFLEVIFPIDASLFVPIASK